MSDLTLTLSNGATITILAGQTSGSTSVAVAPSDDVYADPGSINTSISTATGGGTAVVIDPAPAITTVTDTLDITTVALSASPSVAEGGSITYTASLTNPAQTPVTLTLSNGASIAIAAGASSGSVSVPAPSDDVYVGAGSVSATISMAAGGNFESLVIDPAPATTAITDTLDVTTVSLTASANVAESGSIVYTASLTQAAQSPVSVTLSNGASITIAVGTSSGSVSVPAPSDDVYVDAGSVSATISTATGGNFEALAIDPAAAVTSITDTLDATTLSLTASPSVAEGGSIVYTASLNNPAASPVSVTLSNGATIAIAAGWRCRQRKRHDCFCFRWQFRESCRRPGTCNDQHYRHHRHDHGEPDGLRQRRRGRQHQLHRKPQQRRAGASDDHAVQRRDDHHCRRGLVWQHQRRCAG